MDARCADGWWMMGKERKCGDVEMWGGKWLVGCVMWEVRGWWGSKCERA